MNYTKTELFGKQKSRGTFDDFFDTDKYNSLQEAYDNKDYIHCDFVRDEDNILHIEARHSKATNNKIYHRLDIQNPLFGIDTLDDNAGCELASTLIEQNQ